MKSKECKKHNHKLTSFLKVFIYMLVMLAPFIAIGVKCWYVASNTNAIDSYRGTYAYTEINTLDNIQGTINENATRIATASTPMAWYRINEIPTDQVRINTTGFKQQYWRLAFDVIDLKININNENIEIPNGTKSFVIGTNAASFNLYLKLYSTSINEITFNAESTYGLGWFPSNALATYSLDQYTGTKTIIDFINNNSNILCAGYSNISNFNSYTPILLPHFYLSVYDTNLSSVFYSAIQELDSASIFSWTTDTSIYTAINNMCVNLGIVSPPIAVLLTYWSLITAIYIIIDIVIESFTFLTHWFTDKMV